MPDSSDRSQPDLVEMDRRWVSHELHDGMLQWVIGAKMEAETMHLLAQRGEAASEKQTQYLRDLLSRAMLEGRQLLAGLRPPDLEGSNWHDAVIHWAAIVRSGNSAQLSLSLNEATREIGDMQQRCAFRLVQESVGNALRHAKADSIKVEAETDGRELSIRVIDDGCGFDIDDVPADRFGVKGIRERAAMIGGHAQIESTLGQGTSVRIRIPLEG